jgi:hypothetical protein
MAHFSLSAVRFSCKLWLVLIIISLIASCEKRQKATKATQPLFRQIGSQESGIDFINTVIDTGDITIYDSDLIYAGGGVSIGDINNDGLQDLFVVGNQVGPRLYLNLGDFKFKDITKEAGIFGKHWPTGSTMADVNGDGLTDIYLCISGYKGENDLNNLLFINQGGNKFREAAAEFGIDDPGVSQSASFFDFDNDGDLDLYVVNNIKDIKKSFQIPFYKDKKLFDPANVDRLYENDGKGKFTDITEKSGLVMENADGFTVCAADFDNDGFADLYVSNDLLQPDYYYHNNGNGTFKEVIREKMNVMPMFSMGSTAADLNNDGLLDLVATEMMPPEHLRRKNNMPHPDIEFYDYVLNRTFTTEQRSRNMLQLQNPDGTFSEIGEFANISRTDWSWAALSADFDNDGWNDIFVGNGTKRDLFDQSYLALAFEGKEFTEFKHHRKGKQLITEMPCFQREDFLFRNEGNLHFKNMSAEWGMDAKAPSQGAAYADLDNDGFIDMVINAMDSPLYLYRNIGKTRTGNRSVRFKFNGNTPNTTGIGVKVELYLAGKKLFGQLINGQGWQSNSEPLLSFGTGNAKGADSAVVIWPGGAYQKLGRLASEKTHLIQQANAKGNWYKEQKERSKACESSDVSISPVFLHKESDFLDYRRDKLIPKMISREGPAIAVGDLNMDGKDDFFIGGAAGQAGALYIQQPDGKFRADFNQPWAADANAEDLGVLIADLDGDHAPDIYIASGSNEFESGDSRLSDRLYLNDGKGKFRKSEVELPKGYSKSVVRATDLDSDGDLDLFVAGRLKNQHYPEAVPSKILINNKGVFIDKTNEWCPALQSAGMVTDARFSDFDSDGKADLILCGEWMPIRLFLRTGNSFKEAGASWNLDKTEGWWNCITISDLNGDGKEDIIAGNFGLNSQLKPSIKEPVICYYNDFDQNGYKEPLLCFFKDGILAPYADKDLFCRSMPHFQNKFLTYRSYGACSVEDIFSKESLNQSYTLKANTFQSTVFINEGKKFKAVPLPSLAQVAPVYGIEVLDYNGDKKQDLFLTGNSYSTFYEDGRSAAMRGLMLLGDGNGGFASLSSAQTGISINKDMKSAAMIFNTAQKRWMLLVGSSNDSLKSWLLPATATAVSKKTIQSSKE